jgi:hypothetical protein
MAAPDRVFSLGGGHEMAGDWDWVKVALQGSFSLLSGAAGLFIGIWHAGKKSGKQEADLENKIRQDTDDRLKKAIEKMEATIAVAMDDRHGLVDEFRDTFASLRQKINDVELESERRFLPRDDFTNFLKEYRADMRDLKAMIGKSGLTQQ